MDFFEDAANCGGNGEPQAGKRVFRPAIGRSSARRRARESNRLAAVQRRPRVAAGRARRLPRRCATSKIRRPAKRSVRTARLRRRAR